MVAVHLRAGIDGQAVGEHAAGFAAAYEIPDTATAALGVLLTVAVLATARQTGQPEHFTGNPCSMCRRVGRLSAARPGCQATGGTVRHLPPGRPALGCARRQPARSPRPQGWWP